MSKLTRAHKRWLKKLAGGKIPDHLWPLGVDRRGQLQILEPGQPVPAIKIISEAEERARRPLPLP